MGLGVLVIAIAIAIAYIDISNGIVNQQLHQYHVSYHPFQSISIQIPISGKGHGTSVIRN
jgi:hypothetical protein